MVKDLGCGTLKWLSELGLFRREKSSLKGHAITALDMRRTSLEREDRIALCWSWRHKGLGHGSWRRRQDRTRGGAGGNALGVSELPIMGGVQAYPEFGEGIYLSVLQLFRL